MVAAAVIGSAVVGGVLSSQAQGDAADTAAGAQRDSAALGVGEQRQQFNAIQQLLNPYVNAGTQSLTRQQDSLGLNGTVAQQQFLNSIEGSPQFGALQAQGENAILQNASATGGLRGGNTQAALAQFRPQLLNQLINDQYSKLGGITSLGQNAAAVVGNAGMQTGNAISNLYQQQGAATAGAALAGGRAQAGMWNSVAGGVGQAAGMNGWGSTATQPTSSYPDSGWGSFNWGDGE